MYQSIVVDLQNFDNGVVIGLCVFFSYHCLLLIIHGRGHFLPPLGSSQEMTLNVGGEGRGTVGVSP